MTTSPRRMSRAWISTTAAFIVLTVTSAQAYLVGFDTYSDEGARSWVNTTGIGSTPAVVSGTFAGEALGGSADYEVWAGAPGTGEVSWSVDWHLLSTPTRNIGTVLLYPGSRTPGEFKIWKGTWNGSSMDWTIVTNTTASPVTGVPQAFKPLLVNVDIRNAHGLKYEVIDTGGNRGRSYR